MQYIKKKKNIYIYIALFLVNRLNSKIVEFASCILIKHKLIKKALKNKQ